MSFTVCSISTYAKTSVEIWFSIAGVPRGWTHESHSVHTDCVAHLFPVTGGRMMSLAHEGAEVNLKTLTSNGRKPKSFGTQ